MGLKSVVMIDARDTRDERLTKFSEWLTDNKPSAVGDKYVPDADETRAYLERLKNG